MHNYKLNIIYKLMGIMRSLSLLLLTIFIFSASHSFAQTDDPTDDRKDFREKIAKLRKEKLMEKMNLDETTADNVVNIVSETLDEVRGYNKQKREIYKYIEDNPDAFDVDSKLNELLDLDVKIADVRKQQYSKLKAYLTPQQIAKAYIFNRKFDQELRKKLREYKDKNPDGDNKRRRWNK